MMHRLPQGIERRLIERVLVIFIFLCTTFFAGFALSPALSDADTGTAQQADKSPAINEPQASDDEPDAVEVSEVASAESALAPTLTEVNLPANAVVNAETITRLSFTIRGGLGGSVWRAVTHLWGTPSEDDDNFLAMDS